MNIMYGNNHVGFGDAIFISIVSMAIVFLVLILISFLLSLLKFIPTEKNTVSKENKKTVVTPSVSQTKKQVKKISAEDIKDDRMLAAVAVAVMEAAGNTPNAYIRVKSIKELN
ncbi:OadG family transporter subunit [Leptotrichia sp. oral taxon 221]|uniref:OadG family transporter subunit n=1 Tax=Leptotrichia sp. oral taxon 221 TaxID=712362 RepID=UPI001B8C70DE|nr:OadG family transporter subunit [Leptotrichia sp. oral taxon 221]QUB97595.1 OadG family protein [Leptotrichia sp. oral taxon 221]